MSESAPPIAERPGILRRTAAGAWHVPAGFAYLLMRPRLWPQAALPAFVAALGMIAGAAAGWLVAPHVDVAVVGESWPGWLSIPVRVAIWLGTPLSGMLVGVDKTTITELLESIGVVRHTDRYPLLSIIELWGTRDETKVLPTILMSVDQSTRGRTMIVAASVETRRKAKSTRLRRSSQE